MGNTKDENPAQLLINRLSGGCCTNCRWYDKCILQPGADDNPDESICYDFEWKNDDMPKYNNHPLGVP